MSRSKGSSRSLCTIQLALVLSSLFFGLILFVLQKFDEDVIKKFATVRTHKNVDLLADGIKDITRSLILNSSIEQMVIAEAKEDRQNTKQVARNGLLCVTFMSVKEFSNVSNYFKSSIQLANIFHLRSLCDWAILFYDADTLAAIDLFCSHPIVVLYAVLCRPSWVLTTTSTASMRILTVPVEIPKSLRERLPASTVAVRMSVPKTAMYHELVPLLPSYRSVFLLDEDISLLDVDVTRLLHTWACAFWPHPRPLIAQPLISESTQLFDYVTQKPWMLGERRNVLATASGWVEQQAPLLDAEFFQWFVTRVITHTRSAAFENGADWSADKTWCNAARNFSIEVLHWPLESVPCAIITAPNCSVHHLNTRTMKDKRINRSLFRQRARVVMDRYKTLFPNWVQEDVRRSTNPLDPVNGPRYRKITQIDRSCPNK